MSKDQEFINWWEANKQDIYDKVFSTSWGSVHHFTQLAFEAGKISAQQAVQADAEKQCDHIRTYAAVEDLCSHCDWYKRTA